MKRIKRTQMLSFEGTTLTDFTNDFNKKMEWVEKWVGAPDKYEVDLHNLRGYVIYTENVSLPEGIRDKLDLYDQKVRCEECVHFTAGYKGYGSCPYCRGDIRANDEACEKLFLMWEKGECWVVEQIKGVYDKLLETTELEKVRREGV